MPEPFDAPFMQRALVESLLLAVLAGVLGSWIVLRRLAFFTHGVGSASFPGLVVAGPAGIAPQLAALGASLLYAGGLDRLTRRGRLAQDAATGLLLVGALALGALLASDVFASGAGVDRLLFGSLIGLTGSDLALTAGVVAAVVALDAALRRSWLLSGFDPASPAPAADRLLLAAVAAATVVALDAVGALLVTAVLVIPAATVRLVAPSLRSLQLGTVALAAAEGVAGLVLAFELDVGPGPATAVVGGGVFAATALVTR